MKNIILDWSQIENMSLGIVDQMKKSEWGLDYIVGIVLEYAVNGLYILVNRIPKVLNMH